MMANLHIIENSKRFLEATLVKLEENRARQQEDMNAIATKTQELQEAKQDIEDLKKKLDDQHHSQTELEEKMNALQVELELQVAKITIAEAKHKKEMEANSEDMKQLTLAFERELFNHTDYINDSQMQAAKELEHERVVASAKLAKAERVWSAKLADTEKISLANYKLDVAKGER